MVHACFLGTAHAWTLGVQCFPAVCAVIHEYAQLMLVPADRNTPCSLLLLPAAPASQMTMEWTHEADAVLGFLHPWL